MSGQGRDKGGGKMRGGGGSTKITKSKAMATKELDEKIIHLRKAIFADNGRDKNVLAGIAAPFLKFDRNGLNLEISFASKLTVDEEEWVFDIVKSNMEEVYDVSGYGWDDDDKIKELTEEGTRYLLVREKQLNYDDTPGRLVAFAHFRFTIQGEVMEEMVGETSLHVWDIHVEDVCQRKGLGKHLLTLMELIARREKMKMISIPIQLNHELAESWIRKVGKAFVPDLSLRQLVKFDPEMEGFEVYCKNLDPPVPRIPATTTTTATTTAAASAVSKSAAGEVVTPVKVIGVKEVTPSPMSITGLDQEEERNIYRPDTVSIPSSCDFGTKGEVEDNDWEFVQKKDAVETVKEIEETLTDLNESGEEKGEAEEEDEEEEGEDEEGQEGEEGMNMTIVEADLISQIRLMYLEKEGKQATTVEVREWLKSIRNVEEEEDESEKECVAE